MRYAPALNGVARGRVGSSLSKVCMWVLRPLNKNLAQIERGFVTVNRNICHSEGRSNEEACLLYSGTAVFRAISEILHLRSPSSE